jgi:predicted amidophosphoribosyltransferase
MLQTYVSNVSPVLRGMLHQVLHIVSVFISRRKRRRSSWAQVSEYARASEVGVGGPHLHAQARAHSTKAKQSAQQHAGAQAWVVPTCMHGHVCNTEAK